MCVCVCVCQSCKKCTKVKKNSPDLNLRRKKIPNFPHFFAQFSSFLPKCPHFHLYFLIFSLLSSFFGVISSFFLYFPNFFLLFLIFFLASFFPLNFPQFPQKHFPILNFVPRIQILGSNTFCNSGTCESHSVVNTRDIFRYTKIISHYIPAIQRKASTHHVTFSRIHLFLSQYKCNYG